MLRPRPRRPARRLTALALLGLSLAAACAPGPAPRTRPRTPPADSAAALRRALSAVVPAHRTQEEAIAAGVYRSQAAPPAGTPAAGAPAIPAPEPERRAARPEPLRGEAHAAEAAWAIQIAAFRDEASARALARGAAARLPGWPARVVLEDDLHRVLLVAWPSSAAAERDLAAVRAIYPSAWIRPGIVP